MVARLTFWSNRWKPTRRVLLTMETYFHSCFAGIRVCRVWRLPRRWWRCLRTQWKRPSGWKVGDVQSCNVTDMRQQQIKENYSLIQCKGCPLSTPGELDAPAQETGEGEQLVKVTSSGHRACPSCWEVFCWALIIWTFMTWTVAMARAAFLWFLPPLKKFTCLKSDQAISLAENCFHRDSRAPWLDKWVPWPLACPVLAFSYNSFLSPFKSTIGST